MMPTSSEPPPSLPPALVTVAGQIDFAISPAEAAHPEVAAAVETARGLFRQMKLPNAPHWPVTLQHKEGLTGYRLKVGPAGALIEAGSPEGFRLGVMGLLYRLGVRWYDPGKEPQLPSPPLAIQEGMWTLEPRFPYRGLHICVPPVHYDDELIRWMSFQGMNRKLTHPHQLPKVGNDLQKWGISPDTTVHSYSEWLPDNEYYQSHPEYFALIGGKRVRQSAGGQLCLSNRHMRKAFVSHMQRFLNDNPDISIIGICPNDGYGWCECDDCRAQDSAEDRETGMVNRRIADFVEEICAALARSHPAVMVGHYSYTNHRLFHRYLKTVPPNLIVSATTGRCYRHAMDDASCPTNAAVWKRVSELRSTLSHVYLYDYVYHRAEGLPLPLWRIFERDLKAYERIGLDGYLTETPGAAAEAFRSGHLALYAKARLLLDPGETANSILIDYTSHRFGAAARPMKGYFDRMAQALEEMDGCMTRASDDLIRFLTPVVISDAERWLKQAAELDKGAAVQEEIVIFRQWVDLLKRQKEGQALDQRPVTVYPMTSLPEDTSPALEEEASLVFLDNTSKALPKEGRTVARIYADTEHLGFLIDCFEPDMANVVDRSGNALGNVYGSDSVEIFIQDGQSPDVSYHLLISISGGHCAARSSGTRWNWSWHGGYQAFTSRHSQRWRTRVTIPRRNLNLNDTAAFTLIRNRRPGSWIISGVPAGGAFFNTANYLKARLP